MKPDYFVANGFRLPLDGTSKIMGIVNVTPDSFYDGGKYEITELAVKHAWALVAQGADMIDIGGQTTKPGSHPIIRISCWRPWAVKLSKRCAIVLPKSSVR
ncbi:dihydropteroate synthase [Lacticaseibacillus chiayiensis]|uniref:dihydropteroate synthase n=1 Tax=Lacticaseibacillus chiayiensis TaxID=2100821 RepID=UPI003C78FFE9